MRLDLSLPVILIAIAETLIWAALFYIFPILLLRWEADFGWAREEIALAFTLALVVSALASPFGGRLIDAGLSRWTLPGAAVFGGLALGVIALTESKAAFFGAWAAIGLACAACLYEPCFSFLTRVKGERARGAITTVTLAAGFASTLCFPVADALADAYGWRTAALVFAGVAIFLAAPLFAVAAALLEGGPRPRPAPAEKAASDAAVRAAFRRPAFWLLAAAFPALAVTHGMSISHLMPILADRGATEGAAIFAASLIGPCQVAGRIAITAFAPGRTAAALAMIAAALIALAMALLFLAGGPTTIFAAVALFGAGYGVISIVKPLVTADFLGRDGFGAISGALALPYIACTATAPFLAAILWRAGGHDLTLAVGAGLAFAGLLLLRLAGRAARAIDPSPLPR